MTQATPSHIGHVEKSVEAVQIDEGAEFGEIFHAAFHLGSLVEVGEEFCAFLVPLFFDEFAAGENNVLAVFVEFYDSAFQGLSEEFPKVFWGVDIDLGGGEERLDSDVDHQTAFDDTLDQALDGFSGFAEFDDFVPVLFVGSFLAGEDDLAVLVFKAFEKDFDLLADGEIVRGAEFIEIDGAFGFVSDVDHDFAGAAFDDAAFDNGAFLEVLHRLGQKSFEIGHMVDFLGLEWGPMKRPNLESGARTAGVLC